MSEIRFNHMPDLAHHVQQGAAWLAASENGENTAPLSYAALELRFAVERLTIHYWAVLLDRKLEDEDLYHFESFKRGERRIYKLAGYQKEIDAHFSFMRIVLGAIRVEMPLHTPNVGYLARYWNECSEFCHIAWTLSCSLSEARIKAFAALTGVSLSLSDLVSSLGWPVLKGAAFVELRNRFVAGDASPDEVVAHLNRIGLWARVVFPDGRPAQFVGEPLPPVPS